MDIVHLKDHIEYVPELARLHFDAWGYLRPAETLSERTERLDTMARATDMPVVLVAMESGQLLGSATLQAADGLLPDLDLTPWLAGVYVKAEHRSRGIAGTLIHKVEALALAMGHPTLHLCTHDHEAYYERLGYRTLTKRAFRNETTHIMAKPLR